MPLPAVRIKATVPAEGGDWGGGNPVALASSTYCRFTSARLAPAPVRIKAGGNPLLPSGSKKVGMPPPAVRIKATVPAEGGDWGGGNPVALASSTYCRFTSVSALFRAAAVIFFHRPTPVDV